jgi:hypothetical protein
MTSKDPRMTRGTRRTLLVGAALATATVAGATPAAASTFGVPMTQVTASGGSTASYPGQTFVVPAGEPVLAEVGLGVEASSGPVQLAVAAVTGPFSIGPDLWRGPVVPAPDHAMLTGAPALRVTPGAKYVVYLVGPIGSTTLRFAAGTEYLSGGLAFVNPNGEFYDHASRPQDYDSVFTVTSLPVTLTASVSALAFPEQPAATAGPARSVTFTNASAAPVAVRRTAITGADRDDVLVTDDGCAGTTIAPGATCTVTVRFAPAEDTARPARAATLGLVATDPSQVADDVALTGTAGALPAGPTGPTGPQGPTGPSGDDGAPGAQGPDGLPGATGPAGAPGPVGTTGPQGPAGEPGADGAAGPPGQPGTPGATGDTGAQGLPGVPGPAGPLGLRGPRGRSGLTAVYRCVPREGADARCVVDLSGSTATRTVSVRITRGGKTVAAGSRTLGPRQRQRVVLVAKAAATPGTYRIRIRIRQRGARPQTLTSTFRAAPTEVR